MNSGTASRREYNPTATGAGSKHSSEDSDSGEEAPREECHAAAEERGWSPLHDAAAEGDQERMRELIEGGADTRLRDGSGMTPLHRALDYDREAAAELLAEASCCNDLQDDNGSTPLHLAAVAAFPGVVRKLIQSGVNPHVKNSADEYPLQLALRKWKLNKRIPKVILTSYALRGIPVDTEELRLGERDLRYCIEVLSRCDAEIRLMECTRVPASSLSYLDLVTRHVTRAASRLPGRRVSGAGLARRNFPIYAGLIVCKLRAAEKRRVLTDECLECFSLLSPPLPTTCTEVVLLCLTDDDTESFIRAVRDGRMKRVKKSRGHKFAKCCPVNRGAQNRQKEEENRESYYGFFEEMRKLIEKHSI